MPEQLAVLEHQREVALVRRHTRHVVAVEADAPRVETLQPRDGAQQRRLAAAARAEDGEHAPGVD
ncbi:hypothetical protein QUT23_22500, partial [Xanthomonas citri pv. citri]